ncbi:MAG: aminotransferase class III-fold pyridoxal phosphate-dependent enzyme, partial [Candidatus Latescibacterota bacterium]
MGKQNSHLIWYPGHELLLNDIVRADNCYLYDSKGNRYVDLESGVWCASIGHGHPRILNAIKNQFEQIAHNGFNYSSEVVEESAQAILSLLGFDGGRCVFLCSGSESVEYGVRTAQQISQKPLMMTMTDSYFGAYGSASRKQADEWFLFDWEACVDCPHPDDCNDGCEHWMAIPFEKIGGFILEPGSSSGLVRFPPKKLIRNIVNRIHADDGLVLINEVTTGIGQTGRWFGHQHYDIAPDIVAMGKGVGNGYPVSVTAFAPGVIERLGGEPINYAQSHQNDPLGAVVAREVIRTIKEDNLIDRANRIGGVLASGLRKIKDRFSPIKDVRWRGLMAAVDINEDA